MAATRLIALHVNKGILVTNNLLENMGITPEQLHIITKFEGEKITSYEDLQKIMQYYSVGDTVSVIINRWEGGEYVEKEYKVTLGERPEN